MKERQPNRISSLDGLRGVFSLMVFAGHVWIQQLQGGVVCVDLFFVLSGYLITALLIREHARTGRISLRRFYARRMLRLYPALVAVVAVSFALAEIDHIARPVPDSAAALLYVTDFWRQLQPGHYVSLVLHTWSLGVEEQFYLCWPVILIVALRRGWSLLVLLFGAIVACFLLTGAIHHAHLAFVPVLQWLPTTQGPEFAGGALLAVLQLRTEMIERARPLLGWPVAVASAILIVAVTFHGMHRWWTFGGVTILAWPPIAHLALVPGGVIARMLAWRPAVWLGERSYGIYLVQIPVLVLLARSVHGHISEVLIGLPLTLFLAQLSWVCVEQPFLRIKGRFAIPGVAMTATDGDVQTSSRARRVRADASTANDVEGRIPAWLTRAG